MPLSLNAMLFDINSKVALDTLQDFTHTAMTQVASVRPQHADAVFDFIGRLPKWFIHKGPGVFNEAKNHLDRASSEYSRSLAAVEHQGAIAPFLDGRQLKLYIDFVGLARVVEECNYVFCEGLPTSKAAENKIQLWSNLHPDDWVVGAERSLRRLDTPLLLPPAQPQDKRGVPERSTANAPFRSTPTPIDDFDENEILRDLPKRPTNIEPVDAHVAEKKTTIPPTTPPEELIPKFKIWIESYIPYLEFKSPSINTGFHTLTLQKLWIADGFTVAQYWATLKLMETKGFGTVKNGFYVATTPQKTTNVHTGTQRTVNAKTILLTSDEIRSKLRESNDWVDARVFANSFGVGDRKADVVEELKKMKEHQEVICDIRDGNKYLRLSNV